MGKRDYYKSGDYNVRCDRCGAKFKASQCTLQWNNLFVCYNCYEKRHPQDFVHGVVDDQRVPIARPGGDPVYLKVGDVTPEDL